MRFIDHKKLFFMRLPILMILYLKIISEMILHNDVESQCIKSLKCEINYIGKSLENIEFNLSGPKPIQINNLFYFTKDSIIEFSNSVKIFIFDEEDVSDRIMLNLPYSDEVHIPVQTRFTEYLNELACSPSEPAELIEESETTYKCHILCKYRNYIDIICVSDVSDSIGSKVSGSFLFKLEDIAITNYSNVIRISNAYGFEVNDWCASTLEPEVIVSGVYLWTLHHNQKFIEKINFNYIRPYELDIKTSMYGNNNIVLKLDNVSSIKVADVSPCINNVDVDLLKLATLGDYATYTLGELATDNLKDIYFI